VTGFYRPLLQRLKALPGVVEATETSTLPRTRGIPSDIEIPGKTTHAENGMRCSNFAVRIFSGTENQFVDGRGFTETK